MPSDDLDLANAAQGLKGCDAIYPFDERRAYEGLHRWTELLIAERSRLREREAQAQAERIAAIHSEELAVGDQEAAEARVARLEEALREALDCIVWMSGATAFGPGGEAEQGWKAMRDKLDPLFALAHEEEARA